MSTPQLCQIVISSPDGLLPARAYYQCGLSGRYHAELIGIVFADNTQANDNRAIQIKSDCFRTPYGSIPNSIWTCNRGEHVHGNPQGEFPMIIEATGNSIDLQILSSLAYTNGANNRFDFCILTFKVRPATTLA
jgi:hypothetical protein